MSNSSEPNPMFKESIYWLKLTDKQVQASGTIHTGEAPCWLEIERQDSGYFLHTVPVTRQAGSDTWHQSLDDAFHQAEYAHGVSRDEWNKFHG